MRHPGGKPRRNHQQCGVDRDVRKSLRRKLSLQHFHLPGGRKSLQVQIQICYTNDSVSE